MNKLFNDIQVMIFSKKEKTFESRKLDEQVMKIKKTHGAIVKLRT